MGEKVALRNSDITKREAFPKEKMTNVHIDQEKLEKRNIQDG